MLHDTDARIASTIAAVGTSGQHHGLRAHGHALLLLLASPDCGMLWSWSQCHIQHRQQCPEQHVIAAVLAPQPALVPAALLVVVLLKPQGVLVLALLG